MIRILWFLVALSLPAGLGEVALAAKQKKNDATLQTALDKYIEAARQSAYAHPASTGSTWSAAAPIVDVATDLRARNVHDIVTILVSERASAVSQGTVSSARSSAAESRISALAGIPDPGGGLQNLVNLEGSRTLDGEGETSRRTVLTATMSARVVEVLPNGNLVLEGEKLVGINSERQVIVLRGIVRPYDISVGNTVISERVAQLELTINGKGVVNDAIKRPNILYRILFGWLPF